MKKITKILSMFLAVLMAFSIIPMTNIEADAITYSGSSSYMSSKYYNQLCNVKLTGNQREDIVNVALSQLGYREGSYTNDYSGADDGNYNNYTEYNYWYNKKISSDMPVGGDGAPWCATFVSWCAEQAGIPSSIIRRSTRAGHGSTCFNVNFYAGSSTLASSSDNDKYFKGYNYTPQKGDLIFKRDWSHVGIVVGVSGSNVITVEGNTNNNGSSQGNGVYKLTTRKISDLYFGVPNYTDTSVNTLSIKYDANGGTIAGSDKTYNVYKVETSAGIVLRSGAGTSNSALLTIPKGASFVVTETAKANGYTWGKTTYNGKEGWCVISEDWTSKTGTQPQTKYYLNSSDVVYKSSTGKVFAQEMVDGETYDNGLYNYTTFGISRTGYTFKGWGTKASGGTVYGQNDSMTAKKLCSTIGDGDATITLYAIWEPNVLSVHYSANGGKVTLDDYTLSSGLIYKSSGSKFAQTWQYNVAKELGLVNPKSFGLERTGYTFTGWGTKSTGGTIFDPNDVELLPTEINFNLKNGSCSTTLYAIWNVNTYTVKYNANGGTGTVSNSSHTYDTAKTLNANKFTRTGYTFLGWSTSANATVAKYTDKQSVKNLTSTNGGTVTLYAVWSKNEHTPGEWKVITPATCTTEGLSRLTCTTCGEVIGEKEIPVAEHTAGAWVVTTEATCITEGARYQSCKVCGDVIANEIIPEIGHTADEWEVETEATCAYVGMKNQKCIVCKEIIATEEIPTTDHTYGEFVTVLEPTCETAGIMVQYCDECYEEVASEQIPALGHDYENGICKNCEAFTGIKDDYFYINGVKQKAYQLVEFEGNYYFINNGNLIAKNKRLYLSQQFVEGTDLAVGYYDFDADGKLMFKNGPEGDYFYINGVKQKAYQLVEYEGDFYFINDGNKIAKNKRIYLSEKFVSGFTNADGVALKAGYYEFGADGKMAPMNGPVGDYFYRDNVRLNAYQLVEYNGDFYFINDAHKLAKNKRIYLSAKFVDDFTYSDGRVLKPGYYNFDENGKMLINGPVGDYFYKDSVKLKAYQLVEFEGDYYFINDSNKLAKNKRIYLSAKFVEGTDLAVGYYEFDENGKMLRLNGPFGDYFYEDGVKLKAYQLVEFEGNYYFINDSNKLAKNKRLYMSEKFVEGTGLKAGYYEFDADGKMIIG